MTVVERLLSTRAGVCHVILSGHCEVKKEAVRVPLQRFEQVYTISKECHGGNQSGD